MRLILAVFCFYATVVARAQPLESFYLNAPLNGAFPKCKFSENEIYFYSQSWIIKTDYVGNVIWSKYPNPFQRFKIWKDALYGMSGNIVTKIDTGGNYKWSKTFNQQIYSGNFNLNTHIDDVFLDNENLFVALTQGEYYPDSINFSFSHALVVLDTAGNLLEVNGDTVGYAEEIEIGCGSLLRGGWISANDKGGAFHPSAIVHVDSSGIRDMTSIIAGGQYVTTQEIIAMPDSSYLALFNINDMGGSFSLARFGENGDRLWQCYFGDSSIWGPVSQAYYLAADSLNNIYVLGYCFNGYGSFLLKLDNFGNIIFSRTLNHPENMYFRFFDSTTFSGPKQFNGAHFRQGKLYCVGEFDQMDPKPAILVFDSLGYNSCYSLDSTLVFYKTCYGFQNANQLSGWGSLTYMPSPTTNSLIPDTNPDAIDLCLAIGINKLQLGSLPVQLYPNPFHTTATLSTALNAANAYLRIYNVMGALVREVQIEQLSTYTLHRGNLTDGLYFFDLQSEDHHRIGVGKFIIE